MIRILAAALALVTVSTAAAVDLAEWYTLSKEGSRLQDEGRLIDAEKIFLRTQQLLEGSPPDTPHGVTWNNPGSVYHQSGRYPQAEHAYRRSLDILNRQAGRAKFETGIALMILATLYLESNQLGRAVPLVNQAREIVKLMPDAPRHLAIRFCGLEGANAPGSEARPQG